MAFIMELVKSVSYRENIILIEFNEYMHIEKNEHSYLNKANYLVQIKEVCFPLPRKSKIEIVKKGFIIKIIFPKKPLIKLSNIINKIYLGYVYKNNFFYIQSFNGNIQNIKKPIFLKEEINILNLESGNCSIINDCTLTFYYNGKNEFYSIYLSDFYLNKNNKKYYPKYFTKKHNEINFIFERYIFYEFSYEITFNVVKNPKSKDVYGLYIKEESKIKVKDLRSTYVKSLNFSNYKNKTAYLKIYFSAPLSNFSSEDFLIEYNSNLYKCSYENINNEKNTIDISVYNVKVENFLKNKFKLILLKNKNNSIKTLDYKEKEITIKEEVFSNPFVSYNIEWEKTNYVLKGSLIKIYFQRSINPNSIITNSYFNEEINPLNEYSIKIPSQALIMEKKDNLTRITLKNNQNFGEILINSKENINAINKTIYNKKPCLLYLNCDKLFIKFDNNEESKIDFLSFENIIYNPGKNIRDLNDNFIFFGFSPIKYEILNNIKYIEPLKEEKDNPFTGGIETNNFVLKVDDYSNFRTYGNQNIVTTINGFIRLTGQLNPNKSITFINLKLLGTIFLDIGGSNIIFKNIECDNLIYEKK